MLVAGAYTCMMCISERYPESDRSSFIRAPGPEHLSPLSQRLNERLIYRLKAGYSGSGTRDSGMTRGSLSSTVIFLTKLVNAVFPLTQRVSF